MTKHTHSIDNQVWQRIVLQGKGWVFTPSDFADLGNRTSEQVPARVVFLTDGPSRQLAVGPTHISLKRTTPKNMACAGRLSGLLIQALRFLGEVHVTPERIAHLRNTLPAEQRAKLTADLAYAPVWMRTRLLEVVRP